MLGVGGASLTLASLQLPTPAARGLDIGTGCGIQALRARRDVDRGRRDRHLGARARLHAAQRAAERRRRHRDAAREPVRARGRRAVRPGRVESAVRHHAARSTGVPAYEYRDGGLVGDDLVAAFVTRRRRAPRSRRRRAAARQLGDPRRRRPGSTGCASGSTASAVPLDAWVVERESAGPAVVRRAVGARRRHAARHARVRAPGRRVARRLRGARSVRDRLRLRAAASSGCRRADARAVRARCRRRSSRATASARTSPTRSPPTTGSRRSTTRGSRHPSSSSRPT